MLIEYIPILIFILIVAAFAIGSILFSSFFGVKKSTYEKLMPYECGLDPKGNTSAPFNVHYFLVAILFIIFDLEIIYLFPYAFVFKSAGIFGLLAIFLFIGILLVAYIYALRNNIFDWFKK